MPGPFSRKALTVPPFHSTLPLEFIEGLDDRGKYLYEYVNKATQHMEWLMNQTTKQSETLNMVHDQALKTNGGLHQAKEDITVIKQEVHALKQKDAEAQPVISAGRVVLRAVHSKIVWVLIGLVFISLGTIVLPWLTTLEPGFIMNIMRRWLFGV